MWPLLDVVDECLGEPWLARLAAHLGWSADERRSADRRFGRVRHIADLYDHYGGPPPGDAAGLGARGRRRRLRRPLPAGTELAGRAVAAAAGGDRAAQPGRAARATRAPRLRADARARRPAAPALAVRADPPAGQLPRRCSRARRRARRAPVRAAPLAGAVGGGRRPPASGSRSRPVADGRHRRRSANRLLASWGQRRPRDAARARGAGARRPTTITSSSDGRGHAARRGSRPTSAPTAAARRRRSPASPTPAARSTRATAASRSTPATAAPARSRSCATRSCTCSPTTRRSSRAT